MNWHEGFKSVTGWNGFIQKDVPPVDLLQKLVVCSSARLEDEQPRVQDILLLSSLRELVLENSTLPNEDNEVDYAPLSGIG